MVFSIHTFCYLDEETRTDEILKHAVPYLAIE
jgi:hypothetical protein